MGYLVLRVLSSGLRVKSESKENAQLVARNTQLQRLTNGLFLNHKMHPPVFCPGLFGFSGINWALSAETDRYEPVPLDAFAD